MTIDLEAVRRAFGKDRFAAVNGIELLDLRPGFATARMKIEDRHLNSVGTVQGGAIFTLADFAFAVACNTAGRVAVAVNMNLSCLKAVRSGMLQAEATEISRSNRLSVCMVRVTNEAGELAALFQGTAYIKDAPFPLA
ncbi:MAG: PaaI family thioesterase [Thermoguttaceae bacterium]|jgi:acyl-CoA thioesterase